MRKACGFGLENEIYIFLIFNLLRFIDIGILKITMSVSILYFFPFSSDMQKTNMFSVCSQLSFLKTEKTHPVNFSKFLPIVVVSDGAPILYVPLLFT